MSKILRYAMNVLAVRDHSETELRRKIAAFLYSSSEENGDDSIAVDQEIEQAIAYCAEYGWLDDKRFAQRYISSRSRKGYGVQRIRSELSQKGVDKSTQSDALRASDVDWYQLVQQVAERKFGYPLPTEWKEKAKVQRYLLYRGFSHDEIQSLYTNFSD
ncbi:recombination regulator RecX [Lonsdalea britannica]|uniref:recombination regulator RecX n=1 Tax=Lonsdalea britannica TaxID=1082704 RepID=UPI0026EFE7D8|nr:recombination regulator RecX [Lonsdalea britannica]